MRPYALKRLTLLQACAKPVMIYPGFAVFASDKLALKRDLHCDFATILLAYYGSNHGTVLLTEGMARNIVGNGKEDQRMQLNVRAGVGGSRG